MRPKIYGRSRVINSQSYWIYEVCLSWWQSLGGRMGINFSNWVCQKHQESLLKRSQGSSCTFLDELLGLSCAQWFALPAGSRRCWCGWLQHHTLRLERMGRDLHPAAWRSNCHLQLFSPSSPDGESVQPVWRVCLSLLCLCQLILGALLPRGSCLAYSLVVCLLWSEPGEAHVYEFQDTFCL